MDLIGGIKYIETRLGERKPEPGKRKNARRDAREDGKRSEHERERTHDAEARIGSLVDVDA